MKALLPFFLLGAVLLGGWRVVNHRLERERTAAAGAQAARMGQIERLRLDKTRLQAELTARIDPSGTEPRSRQPEPQTDARPTRAQSSSQDLARMIADGTVKLGSSSSGIDVLVPTASGAFPDNFGKLFELDDATMVKLQDDMIAIRNRVEALIAARSTLTRNDDGSVVIACAPLPEGETLRQEFRALLLGAIGPEGLASYLALMRPENPQTGSGGFNDFYYAFGANGVIWTIKPQTSGTYDYKRVGEPAGRSTGNTPSSGSYLQRSQLLIRLGPQAALLPADF